MQVQTSVSESAAGWRAALFKFQEVEKAAKSSAFDGMAEGLDGSAMPEDKFYCCSQRSHAVIAHAADPQGGDCVPSAIQQSHLPPHLQDAGAAKAS